jgi:hypothetical protein
MALTSHSSIDEDSPDEHTQENKYIPSLTHLIFRPSIVRFRLPLTPPHGTEMPPKSTLYREVGTKDSSSDVPKVNLSASKWTEADLGCLGVDYQYRAFDDIQIGTEDGDIPPELLQSNNQFMAD